MHGTTGRPVHPVAALFPMMAADELAELAADIAANGLNHAIIVDRDGVLLDGRNRLAACEIAGVEPKFVTLPDGRDPIDFIVSENIERRHLTKGQRAMALAMIYPEADRPGRGHKGKASETDGFSPTRLKQARMILRHSRELAEAVLAGASFDAAFDDVQKRLGNDRNQKARLRRLAEERPDLAEQVSAGSLTLEAAEKKAKDDATEQKQRRWAATMNVIDGYNLLNHSIEQAAEWAALYDPAHAETRGEGVTPKRIRDLATFLNAYADELEKRL